MVHIDHGIGIYEGLQKMDVNGKEQEVIKLSYKDGDLLYISIHSLHKISKYVGKDGMPPKLHRLGSGTWERVKGIANVDYTSGFGIKRALYPIFFSIELYRCSGDVQNSTLLQRVELRRNRKVLSPMR